MNARQLYVVAREVNRGEVSCRPVIERTSYCLLNFLDSTSLFLSLYALIINMVWFHKLLLRLKFVFKSELESRLVTLVLVLDALARIEEIQRHASISR